MPHWDDTASWFRSRDQRDMVCDIIRDRLADDRQQEECRFLMKFWWHLRVDYPEVTFDELAEALSPAKLAIINELLQAVDRGPDAVDLWVHRLHSSPVARESGED